MRTIKKISLRLLQMYVDPWFAHAFTLFTDVCFWYESQLRPKTDLVGWWCSVLFSPPREPPPPHSYGLWALMMFPCGYNHDSSGSCERKIGWRLSAVGCQSRFGQSEFDFLDADKDPKWPLLVFLWCMHRNNKANQCLKCSHTFFHAVNMCQTQNMNATDMHAAASLSPAATLGYLSWGPQLSV